MTLTGRVRNRVQGESWSRDGRGREKGKVDVVVVVVVVLEAVVGGRRQCESGLHFPALCDTLLVFLFFSFFSVQSKVY